MCAMQLLVKPLATRRWFSCGQIEICVYVCAGLLWQVRPLPGVSQAGRRRQMDAGAQDRGGSTVGSKSTSSNLLLLSSVNCHCQLAGLTESHTATLI